MAPYPDPAGPLAGALVDGGVLVVLYLLLTIGLAALSLWITYTVIWRAARRGLREFHYPGIKMKGLSAQSVPRGPADPSDWSLFDGR